MLELVLMLQGALWDEVVVAEQASMSSTFMSCNLMAALVDRNCAHSNKPSHRSMVLHSSE